MTPLTEFLQKVDVFSMLTSEEIDNIVDYLKVIEIGEGGKLFKEGDEGNELYIVKSGRAAISIRLSDGKEREIAEFKSGDFFGEMSIFDNAPRSATCRIKEKSCLLTMLEGDFFRLIKHFPYIAIKIMYRMLNITTQRLRNTGEFLTDMVLWGEKARRRSITDELTGVYNRRFLDDAMEDCVGASKNTGKSVSLIMVDLDRFREINELYSPETGDQIILEVVKVFKKYLRESDIIARYGGDEFTVILPETGLYEAKAIAEKVRGEVAGLKILENRSGPIKNVTTSQGIASFPENAEDLKTLREKADRALYRAKDEGRNRVVCAGQSDRKT